jgi:hypothetical protein
MEKGREEGREEGREAAARTYLMKLISGRFGAAPADVAAWVATAAQSACEAAFDAAMRAENCEEFRTLIGVPASSGA